MTTTPGLDAYLAAREDRCPRGFAPTQHPGLCTPTHAPVDIAPAPADEWSIFTAALRASVGADGVVHQSDMRPRLRGRVAPKHIGALYRRAKSDGLLIDTGEREQSNDVAGRNTDKLDRLYRLVGTTSDRKAA